MGAYNNIQGRIYRAIGRKIRPNDSRFKIEPQQDSSNQNQSNKKPLPRSLVFLAAVIAGVSGSWGYAKWTNPEGLGCDVDLNIGAEYVKEKVIDLKDSQGELAIADLDSIGHETRISTLKYTQSINCPKRTQRMVEAGRMREMTQQYKDLGR